jgi:hypothetical protein
VAPAHRSAGGSAPSSARASQGQPITARSSWGASSGEAIRPDPRINVGGTETTISAALTANLIRKQGNDYYAVDASATQPTDADIAMLRAGKGSASQFDEIYGPGAATKALADQPPVEPGKVADLDPQSHAIAGEFTSKVDNVSIEAGMRSVIEHGTMPDDLVGSVAGQMGPEAAEVRSRVARCVPASRTKRSL